MADGVKPRSSTSSATINPYRPPRAAHAGERRETPRSGAAYNVINNVYAVLLTIALFILAKNGQLAPDSGTVIVLAVFIAPFVTYLLVRKGTGRSLRLFLLGQLGLVLFLLSLFVENLSDRGLDQGIGYFMIGINVVSLAFGFRRLRQREGTDLTAAVQSAEGAGAEP